MFIRNTYKLPLLLLLLGAFSPSRLVGSEKVSGACQARIARHYQSSSIVDRERPPIPVLKINYADIRDVFLMARLSWDQATVPDQIKSLLVDRKTAAVQLKEIRKKGLLLRTAYLIFDQNHKPPGAFSDFLRQLGLINDLLAIGDAREIPPQLESILGSGDFFRQNLPDLIPSDQESIADFLNPIFVADHKILKAKRITITEFHTVRKHVRELRNVFRLLRLQSEDADLKFKKIDKYLSRVNETLGTINDDLFKEFMRWRSRRKGDFSSDRNSFEDRMMPILSEELWEKIWDQMKTIRMERADYEDRMKLVLPKELGEKIWDLMKAFRQALRCG